MKDLGGEFVLLADPGADGREGLGLAGQAGQRLVAAAIDRGGGIPVGQPDPRLRCFDPPALRPLVKRPPSRLVFQPGSMRAM
ncbi:MAG: hypothetical protein ABSB49_15075 [Polyangia bacterium]